MADLHGSPAAGTQNPSAAGSGPAPVPYAGSLPSEPPMYAIDMAMGEPSGEVMNGIPPMPGVIQESGYAHDINAGLCTPYYGGPVSPILGAGDGDAGDADDVRDSVAGSVAAATGRWQMNMASNGTSGTPGPGSMPVNAGTIGDLITFPPSGEDPGAGVGNTMPTGGFYDPDREYGGTQGPPGYQGEAI